MLPVKATLGAALQSARHLVPRARSGFSSHLLRWLVSLGGVGLFGVAVIDSSMIPIPLPGSTDLLLLLLSAHRYTSVSLAVSFVAWAFAGSVLGGYLTWSAGVKGGNAALEKLGRGRFVRRVTSWVKRNGMLSVGIAALLPPPIPLLPFVLAAGALGVTRGRFLLSYCGARMLRYSFVGWLGFRFGRRVVQLFQKELKGWSTTIISIYIGLVAAGAAYGVWKYFRDRRK
jgi:membrane protein YqaA with SNARE-associated domain